MRSACVWRAESESHRLLVFCRLSCKSSVKPVSHLHYDGQTDCISSDCVVTVCCYSVFCVCVTVRIGISIN